jgi:hypothetical protein
MAGQKAVNTAAKKAASDGKITGKEAKAIQQVAAKSGGSTAVAVSNQAAKGVAVTSNAQKNTGLEIKGNGQITYNPAAATSQLSYLDQARINYGVIPNPAPAPVNAKFAQNTAGTYSYTAPTAPRVTTSGVLPGQITMESGSNAGGPKAPATSDPPAGTQNWNNTIDANTQALIDALNEQTATNARNQELYMGMMSDLSAQMAAANQQSTQQAGPYAVTTSAAAPAAGAQTTTAIAARRKPLANTSLAIGPLTAAGLGTGLNIPV